jgi:hypothetical protein
MVCHFAEQPQNSAFPAFVYPFYCFDQFFGCEPFEIAHDVWQRILLRADNHMKVTGHEAPSVDDQALLFLTVAQRINDYVSQFPAGKQIYPANGSHGNKIQPLMISELVLF